MILTHRRATSTLPVATPRFVPGAILFAERGNEHYGRWVWKIDGDALPYVPDEVVTMAMRFYGIAWDDAEDVVRPSRIVDSGGAWENAEFCYEVWERFEVPAFRTPDGAVVLDSEILGPPRKE